MKPTERETFFQGMQAWAETRLRCAADRAERCEAGVDFRAANQALRLTPGTKVWIDVDHLASGKVYNTADKPGVIGSTYTARGDLEVIVDLGPELRLYFAPLDLYERDVVQEVPA